MTTRTPTWPWWLAAFASALVLLLLATNRGFYNADELDLLAAAPLTWREWQWLPHGPSLFHRPLGFALLSLQLRAAPTPSLVHTISVLHHVANYALFAMVLGRIGLPRSIALLAFWPSAVPGIAWVAAMYDRAALTLLLAVTLLLSARRSLPLLAIAVFAIALVTKETSIGFVVPAALIAWRRRADPERAAMLVAAAAIACLGIAFAVWRLATVPHVPEYAVAFDFGNVVRVARLVAFPFAPTAMDPWTVRGTEWLGAIGSAVLFVIALRGSWRWTLVGVACAGAAIAPVAMLPKVEGHHLHLATPGVLLVVAAALRDGARASRALLMALSAIAFVHSLQIATDYRVMGSAMTDLQAAHRAAAPDVPFLVHGPAWRGESVAKRYQVHANSRGLLPPVQLVDAPRPGTWIVGDDGSVRLAR